MLRAIRADARGKNGPGLITEGGHKLKKLHIYLMLFCIMIAWGFNVVATKILGATFMPVTMTSARLLVAGLFIFVFLFMIKGVRKLTKKEWLIVVVGSIFNVVGHHYFLAMGLTQTSASNGGLILGAGPLLTAMLAFLFLKKQLSGLRVAGILLGFTGVAFIVMQGNVGISGVSLGDVFVFLSIFSQAISFIIISKVSKTFEPRLMTGYMLVIGSVIMFCISRFLEPNGIQSLLQAPGAGIWTLFFASAIIATALGQMLYNFAIGQVGPSEASVFMNFSPFFTLVGSALFLGEKISVTHVIGLLAIVLGVVLGSSVWEELRGRRNPQLNSK